MKPAEQAVEGDEAGVEREDAVELCRQGGLARRAWMLAIVFEIAVERPDCGAAAVLGEAVLVRESVELVNQPPLSRGSAWIQHSACRPTLNWPASSLVPAQAGITVSLRKPWALMLPPNGAPNWRP